MESRYHVDQLNSPAAENDVEHLGGYTLQLSSSHRTSAITMECFKVGDRVVVIPRFARLFESDPATVMEVKLDHTRPMFNEYEIEFADGSIANVFEFQIRPATD